MPNLFKKRNGKFIIHFQNLFYNLTEKNRIYLKEIISIVMGKITFTKNIVKYNYFRNNKLINIS